jgi:hypothetical protein
MKKILITFSFLFSFLFSKAQSKVDSFVISTPTQEFVTCGLIEKDSSLKVDSICDFSNTIKKMNEHNKSDSSQIIHKIVKQEKILSKKRIVIVSAVIGLQLLFGFDPKFTLINLIWLAF